MTATTTTVPAYTAEQIAKRAKARKGELLTTAQLAVYIGRSIAWIQMQKADGKFAPDGKLDSGKRGRPTFLHAKGKYTAMAKANAKAAAARQKKAAAKVAAPVAVIAPAAEAAPVADAA